jgi:AraC family transcriptional regulator
MGYNGLVAHRDGDPAAMVALEGRLEHGLQFPHGRAEIRRHAPSRLIDDVYSVREDIYLVNLALSRRPPPTTIAHLEGGKAEAARQIGRVFLAPPGSTVRITTAPGASRSLHCALSADLIDALLPCKAVWNEARRDETAQVDSPELEWLLLKISRELAHAGFGAGVVVESLVHAVGVELIRRFHLADAEAPRLRKGGLAPWRMRRLRDRIYADEPAPSLDELAGLCGMTVRQLARAFKVETGQTVGKFVEAAMLERARALLADTGLSIADIARALGFAHPASFSYAFRRATGLNPSEVEGRRVRRLHA